MSIRRFLLLLAALLCLSGTAGAQILLGRGARAAMENAEAENAALRAKVDSLLEVIEALRSLEITEAEEQEEALAPVVEYTAQLTDSLLGQWYRDRLAQDEVITENLDSVSFVSNVPDSVLIARLERMNAYITLPFNETVKNYMILYSEKMPTKMGRILGMANYYMPIFEEAFARYEMPLELKYMAIIESALDPTARSRAGALGIWQFMYTTGRSYGLKITSYIDERMDVEKAADAAARYLMDAYRIFGDWCLAISSYNCGAGNVNKAIRRAGGKRDFWSIYPYLPRETRGYMPAFVGAMYAMTYYKEYGLVPAPTPLPIASDTLEIRRNLHFKQVSEVVGVPIELLREMNPQYIHDIIPGAGGSCILKIPFEYTGNFIEHADTVYAHKADSLISEKVIKNIAEGGNGSGAVIYRVKSGDNLGKIARQYHVSVAQLRRWNGISGSMLRIGQRLTVYPGGSGAPAASASSSATAKSASTASGSKTAQSSAPKVFGSGNYTVYTVKSGDSLYSIAKLFPGVSANDIMSFNGITSSIKPGMQLRIPSAK